MKGERLVNKKVDMAIREYNKKYRGGYGFIDALCVNRIFYAYFSKKN